VNHSRRGQFPRFLMMPSLKEAPSLQEAGKPAENGHKGQEILAMDTCGTISGSERVSDGD